MAKKTKVNSTEVLSKMKEMNLVWEKMQQDLSIIIESDDDCLQMYDSAHKAIDKINNLCAYLKQLKRCTKRILTAIPSMAREQESWKHTCSSCNKIVKEYWKMHRVSVGGSVGEYCGKCVMNFSGYDPKYLLRKRRG